VRTLADYTSVNLIIPQFHGRTDPAVPKADPESKQLVSTLKALGKDRLRLDELHRARTAEAMIAVLAQVQVPVASALARVTTR
jgi:hypothetical protein